MTRSSSLVPGPLAFASRFVNNYVTTEITYSTAHVRYEVLAWPQATLLYKLHLESQEKMLHYAYIMVRLLLLLLLSRSVVSDSLDRMDCSLPGSSIHGMFQARVLEWGALAFSDGWLGYVMTAAMAAR